MGLIIAANPQIDLNKQTKFCVNLVSIFEV